MKRLFCLWLNAISLSVTLSYLDAQQSRPIPRIGYLATDSHAPTREIFLQGLEDSGYFENKTIHIEWRFAESNLSRFSELAKQLVGLKLAVIVAGNSLALNALKHATTATPLVMAMYAGDPVADGVVTSLARPGGNITGVIPLAPELTGKQLEVIKETLPKASRVAVMWNPNDSEARGPWNETQLAARALGLQILSVELRSQNGLDRAMDSARRAPSDALLVLRGGVSYLLRKQIVALATSYRLPSMFYANEFVEAGGLMSYASNNMAQYRRAAIYVDKILKGAKPSELPIEQPTKFELVINLKTAKQIGLTIPPNVLARADRVIR